LENEVIVCTRKSNENEPDIEKYQNLKIFRINTISKKNQNRTLNFLKKQLTLKIYRKEEMLILKENLKNIILNEQPEYVMPITMEEIVACLELKKELDFKLVPYLFEILPVYKSFDILFINNIIKTKKVEKLKDVLYKESYKIFLISTLKDYFKEEKKLIYTEHPMVVNDILYTENNAKNNILITYIGGLDLRIRNPKKVLEIFSNLFENFKNNFKVEFYTYGNCKNMVDEFSNKYNSNFSSHSGVIPDEAHKKIRESDIIITIGNNKSKLVPSKIFDCISTGNPIIHFYYNDSDKYLEYLKNYKLSICINLNDSASENAEKLNKFIIENYGKKMEFSEIKKYFEECTPEYVAKVITDNI